MNIKKSILSTFLVIFILIIAGVFYWLIFNQVNTPAGFITIIITAVVSSFLALVIYNFMLKPRDKDIKVTKTNKKEANLNDEESNEVDIYSINNPMSSKKESLNTKNNEITI